MTNDLKIINKYQLTQSGCDFIRDYCKKNYNTLISGKNKYGLPYSRYAYDVDKKWISKAKYDGKSIDNGDMLGNALIDWYNKYGELFKIDPNILAAQAYAESGYKLWNYAKTSTASGISQFIKSTVKEIIINNKFNITDILFTEDEIVAITKDVDLINYENISNRHQLHQNITDNPEIMIKAQFIYMNYIGNKCDYLASSSLFGYNRGHAFVKKNYKDSIISAAKYKLYYEIEGIGYVDKIFKFLIKYFGYNDLKKDYDD